MTWQRRNTNRAGLAQLLGFQGGFKVGQGLGDAVPALAALEQPLELDEPLEGHGDGELDPGGVEVRHQLFAEERAVQADLELHAGQRAAQAVHTGGHEGQGPAGVVHIARPVREVQHLPGLGDRAEERIVAARPLLLLVEPDGTAFGRPMC